jgi:cyanophycinase-like exopeptidase
VTGRPRLLAIMGSGETSPTMIKTHRRLLASTDRVGPAVLLDTPVGFQENASDISARAVEYFRDGVGHDITVARWRSVDEDAVTYEEMLTALRTAGYVFAGPGSPSYTLRQWASTPVPDLLAAKLRDGGCVTFASAAALTLGVVTVPVYEIYKVGEDPQWLPGLDLLGAATGVAAAVIPHYDNAEGGTHDTRFCYLGERRLALLEKELPPDTFVLGVDEHTACIIDLVDASVTVEGLGGVTIRRSGESHVLRTGTTVALSELASAGDAVAAAPAPSADDGGKGNEGSNVEHSPLLASAAELEARFDAALRQLDVRGAVAAMLELEEALVAWSRDTLQSDEPDRARAVLRSMIVRLGQLTDVGPLVDALLELRNRARAERRFDDSDWVRDQLVEFGVEVHDTPEGSSWRLLS